MNKSSSRVVSLKDFAKLIYDLQKSDRDVNMAVAGFTGEGKSCFMTQLQMEHATVTGKHWDFSRMTWSREEMMMWIDGKEGSEKDANGLREGQLPEYSSINPDELFHMFYRRNWFDEGQQESIKVFNMCRDRHLFVGGNIPNFWELDGSFSSRIRFFAYIPMRGIAWVFEQENNPFARDNWNQKENLKIFRKHGNPYKCPNFLFEVHYPDWTPEQKVEYYRIRNEKRLTSTMKEQPNEKYADIKHQRDALIRVVSSELGYTQDEIAEVIGVNRSLISRVLVVKYNKNCESVKL